MTGSAGEFFHSHTNGSSGESRLREKHLYFKQSLSPQFLSLIHKYDDSTGIILDVYNASWFVNIRLAKFIAQMPTAVVAQLGWAEVESLELNPDLPCVQQN